MTGFWVYKTASWLSRALPLSCAYWLGLRIADLFFAFDRKGREAVMENVRHLYAFRGEEHQHVALRARARETYRHFSKYLVDFFRYGVLNNEWADHAVRVEGVAHLDHAVASGRGVILVTPHFGSWELGAAVLAGRGHKLHAVVLPYRSERIERLFNHYREQRGIHTIPFGRAVRDLIQCLRAGHMVALLADRDYSAHHHEATLFGQTVCMPRGPAWLAIKTGAPVLPSFMVRQPDDTFILRFHPPLYPGELKTETAIRDRVGSVLEQEIGEEPHQWFMFEDFRANRGDQHRGHRDE